MELYKKNGVIMNRTIEKTDSHKKIFNLALALFLCVLGTLYADNKNSAITYTFDGAGRFGDCILIYCKAQYYAMYYGLPIIYKPFPFSDQLCTHAYHKQYPYTGDTLFRATKKVKSKTDINKEEHNILYTIDLFTSLTEKPHVADPGNKSMLNDHWVNFLADEIHEKMLEDITYYALIKNRIRFLNPQAIMLPSSTVRLAVHVRTGGGYDGQLYSSRFKDVANITSCRIPNVTQRFHDCVFPLKFPPEQFYVDQINTLAEALEGHSLYVEIFTDDREPDTMLSAFRSKCKGKNISIQLGTKSAWYVTPIHDLYRMTQFDCIIKPCSSYSGVAQIMGDYKVIIYPDKHCWDNNFLCITESVMQIKSEDRKYEKLKLMYRQPIAKPLRGRVQTLLCHNWC